MPTLDFVNETRNQTYPLQPGNYTFTSGDTQAILDEFIWDLELIMGPMIDLDYTTGVWLFSIVTSSTEVVFTFKFGDGSQPITFTAIRIDGEGTVYGVSSDPSIAVGFIQVGNLESLGDSVTSAAAAGEEAPVELARIQASLNHNLTSISIANKFGTLFIDQGCNIADELSLKATHHWPLNDLENSTTVTPKLGPVEGTVEGTTSAVSFIPDTYAVLISPDVSTAAAINFGDNVTMRYRPEVDDFSYTVLFFGDAEGPLMKRSSGGTTTFDVSIVNLVPAESSRIDVTVGDQNVSISIPVDAIWHSLAVTNESDAIQPPIFAGSTSFPTGRSVTIPFAAPVSFPFSMGCFFKNADPDDGTRTVMSLGVTDSDDMRYELVVNISTDQTSILCIDKNGLLTGVIASSTVFTDDEWHIIVAVFESPSSRTVFFDTISAADATALDEQLEFARIRMGTEAGLTGLTASELDGSMHWNFILQGSLDQTAVTSLSATETEAAYRAVLEANGDILRFWSFDILERTTSTIFEDIGKYQMPEITSSTVGSNKVAAPVGVVPFSIPAPYSTDDYAIELTGTPSSGPGTFIDAGIGVDISDGGTLCAWFWPNIPEDAVDTTTTGGGGGQLTGGHYQIMSTSFGPNNRLNMCVAHDPSGSPAGNEAADLSFAAGYRDGNFIDPKSNTGVNNRAWNFGAVSYDASTFTNIIMLNGSTASPGTLKPWDSGYDHKTIIGAVARPIGAPHPRYFPGSIAGVAIFTDTLTSGQLTNLYNAATMDDYEALANTYGVKHFWRLTKSSTAPTVATSPFAGDVPTPFGPVNERHFDNFNAIVYLDGIAITSMGATGFVTPIGDDWTIGGQAGRSGPDTLALNISDPALYDYALSADDILNLHNKAALKEIPGDLYEIRATSMTGAITIEGGRHCEVAQLDVNNELSVSVNNSVTQAEADACNDLEVLPPGWTDDQALCNEIVHSLNGVEPNPNNNAITIAGSKGVTVTRPALNRLKIEINQDVLFKPPPTA